MRSMLSPATKNGGNDKSSLMLERVGLFDK